MSQNDLFVRFLIANNYASPIEYQRLMAEYENRGFYLNLVPPTSKYTSHDDLIEKLQNRDRPDSKVDVPKLSNRKTPEEERR